MTSSLFFLSTLNYDARSTTHQMCHTICLHFCFLVSRPGMGEYNFLLFFLSGGAKLLSREQCVGWLTHDIVAALWSCSRQKYLELWPAAWNEAWRSVLMLMKGHKNPRIELNTVHCISITHCLRTTNSSTRDVGIIASACSLPNLRFDVRPSWNNIHYTFPIGTGQDMALTYI